MSKKGKGSEVQNVRVAIAEKRGYLRARAGSCQADLLDNGGHQPKRLLMRVSRRLVD